MGKQTAITDEEIIAALLASTTIAEAEIMTDKEINPAIRLQAAQTIIANAAKFSERLQFEELSNLENNVKSIWEIEL